MLRKLVDAGMTPGKAPNSSASADPPPTGSSGGSGEGKPDHVQLRCVPKDLSARIPWILFPRPVAGQTLRNRMGWFRGKNPVTAPTSISPPSRTFLKSGSRAGDPPLLAQQACTLGITVARRMMLIACP